MSKRNNKTSVTDNVQIQRHGSGCCITIYNKMTGKSCELTEATLETIIRNNNLIVTGSILDVYRSNDSIIEHLIREYNEWKGQQKGEQD